MINLIYKKIMIVSGGLRINYGGAVIMAMAMIVASQINLMNRVPMRIRSHKNEKASILPLSVGPLTIASLPIGEHNISTNCMISGAMPGAAADAPCLPALCPMHLPTEPYAPRFHASKTLTSALSYLLDSHKSRNASATCCRSIVKESFAFASSPTLTNV